ncbi:MAG TPA: SRPBCC family protein [Dehalococcoidia bacterium]|nr:SRPBCC family protein [Dehalococcoidia bacterium]
MAKIEKSIEVEVPLETAYNQWTQFEEFPRFMEGVREVRQLDDERLAWVAEVGGERKEWLARITRQVPDQVVAWESEGGVPNAGVVTFHRLGGSRTEVSVQMDYEPEDLKEEVGDKLGFAARRVEGDLKRFKEFIEERGVETGAWRGRIGPEGVSGREPYEKKDYSAEGTFTPGEARTGPAEGRGPGEESPRAGSIERRDVGTGPETADTPLGDTREIGRRDDYGSEGSGGTHH